MSLLDPDRFYPLAAAFLLGALLAGGVLTAAPIVEPDAPDPDNPAYSVATATGCLPPDDATHGWVHETTVEDARVVSVNLSVPHDAGEGVDARLAIPGNQRYVLDIDTRPEPDDKGPAPDCEHGYGSTVEFGASLPWSFSSFAVTVEDERIFETTSLDETTPHHWDLARASNATA